jgi:hypothetical protein
MFRTLSILFLNFFNKKAASSDPIMQPYAPPARSRELLARSRERRIKFCEQRKKSCERLIKSSEPRQKSRQSAFYLYIMQRFFRHILPVRRHRESGKTASPMRRERERAKPAPFLSISAAPVGDAAARVEQVCSKAAQASAIIHMCAGRRR